MHIVYWWQSNKERYYWEDQDVGGWTILKRILREIGLDSIDWIDSAHDRDQWRALVNTMTTFGFHKMMEQFKLLE
jgi:hypothetical protein